jgi:hypothetical protein
MNKKVDLAKLSLDTKFMQCHEVIRVTGDGLDIAYDISETRGIFPADITIRIKSPHTHIINSSKKYENSELITYEILILEQHRLEHQ